MLLMPFPPFLPQSLCSMIVFPPLNSLAPGLFHWIPSKIPILFKMNPSCPHHAVHMAGVKHTQFIFTFMSTDVRWTPPYDQCSPISQGVNLVYTPPGPCSLFLWKNIAEGNSRVLPPPYSLICWHVSPVLCFPSHIVHSCPYSSPKPTPSTGTSDTIPFTLTRASVVSCSCTITSSHPLLITYINISTCCDIFYILFTF